MSIYTKNEIVEALNKNINAFSDYILSLNKEQFEIMPEGKWSAGQNLYHLILSIEPLQSAFEVTNLI